MTALAERTHWDAHAEDRLAVWGEPDWDGSVSPCLDAIIPELSLGERANVLDLGCGPGRLAIPVAKLNPGWSVYGVDSSPVMLAQAWRARRASEVFTTRFDVRFILGDGRTLPEELPLIDGAWSMLLFQHIPDDAVAHYLREVATALLPGRRFRFQFVVGTEQSFLHQHRSVVDVTTWCEQAGLEVLAVDLNLLSPGWCWMTTVKP